MIRIEELKLHLSQNETELKNMTATVLHCPFTAVKTCTLVKKAIDSRKKSDIVFVYTVDVETTDNEAILTALFQSKNAEIRQQIKFHRIRMVEQFQYIGPSFSKSFKENILVVGAGPCGLFAALALARAGLSPIVVERGKPVENREQDVKAFFENGILNPESNVQFGEGGAGTFSDGKLYTLVNDKRSHFIFQTLVECGAPEAILHDAKPHIGTDILRKVVANLRKKIIDLGGSFRFETKLTGLNIKDNVLQSVFLNETEEIPVATMILAIGHSARDTFEMLLENRLALQQKAFSVGVRIEHPAELINRSQYGAFSGHEKLPVAKYKLAEHLPNGRSVYTFCMCPGGYVVAAASELDTVTINGMSEFAQDNVNSNSAVLVNVHPSDFGSSHPLAGIIFQRNIEQKAFQMGGNNYFAPAQTVEDFLKSTVTKRFIDIKPSYRPQTTTAKLSDCFPDFVIESLKMGIVAMDKKLRGFAFPAAVLTAPETRSSSPIQILRDENCCSSVRNIFPAGEGAGYAGGIVSSAIDGLRVAEAIFTIFDDEKFVASTISFLPSSQNAEPK